MKLKRFLLRYHPPGIILEYLRKNGEIETKSIDLLNLTPEYVPSNLYLFTLIHFIKLKEIELIFKNHVVLKYLY